MQTYIIIIYYSAWIISPLGNNGLQLSVHLLEIAGTQNSLRTTTIRNRIQCYARNDDQHMNLICVTGKLWSETDQQAAAILDWATSLGAFNQQKSFQTLLDL